MPSGARTATSTPRNRTTRTPPPSARSRWCTDSARLVDGGGWERTTPAGIVGRVAGFDRFRLSRRHSPTRFLRHRPIALQRRRRHLARKQGGQHAPQRRPAFPQRVQADGDEGAKDPDDAHADPAREELLGKDIAGALALLLGKGGLPGELGLALGLGVRPRGVQKVVVVCPADGQHRLPVVLFEAEDEAEHGDEDEGRQQRGDVAREHGVVGAGALDVERAARLARGDEPGGDGAGGAEDGRERGRPAVLAAPEQRQRRRDDGGGDEDAHEQVQVAHGDAVVPQADGDAADDGGVGGHGHVRHPDEQLAAGVGAEVGAVDVVGEDGRRGDELRVEGRRDGQEDHDEGRDGAALAEERDGGVGQGKAGRDVGLAHAVGVGREARAGLEGQRGQAQRRGRQPGDGEPGGAADDVPGEGVDGVRGDGLVVVAVVEEDGAEVADDVDDEEDDAALGAHRQVAAVLVAGDGVRPGGLDEQVVDGRRAAEDVRGGVGAEGEDDDDDEDDEGVDVVGDEGGLEPADEGVGDDGDGHEEDGGHGVDARQRVDGGGAAGDEHERHEHVGREAEGDEGEVRRGAVARPDGLEEGVRVGGALLERDGQRGEQQDLDRRARRVPEGAGDAVAVADAGALQEGGGPGPGGDDGGGDEARLHGAAGRVEHLGRLDLVVEAPEDVGEGDLAEHVVSSERRGRRAPRGMRNPTMKTAKAKPTPRTMP
ncbi:Uncharacterized protein TCAP_07380 [Tolypocladium capitatum]|uniref:Uncharacterized protein n=1 Tax=Tolypocladium capitatum TaxID=45235 RepID=A0A2K3PZ54_9HYPO|nr:Uncharacterized protein TCAP_07380 [Tolypocladium capitatum]